MNTGDLRTAKAPSLTGVCTPELEVKIFPDVGSKAFIAYLKLYPSRLDMWEIITCEQSRKASLGATSLKTNGASWWFRCISADVCVRVGLVPVSCWAVASLCSISCLSALWAVAGPGGGETDVEGGGMQALL